MHWSLWLDDLRFAVRGARRRPVFTLLVVATLALGLGVNGAVFALVDSVLLRPLPYQQPDRLVFVWQTLPRHDVLELEATPFDYAAWHRAKSFSALALVATDSYTLTGGADAERVHGARTTASLLPLLGIGPRLGRGFAPEEDSDGAARVVLLGDGLWRRRFGADPGILGRAILVDGAPHTVVGVMGPGAQLPGPLAGSDEIWLPARMTPSERANPVSHNYTVLARLADGVTPAQASAEMATLAATLTAEHPDSHTGLGARVVPIAEDTVRAIRPALLLLFGGVALLLLVACANVATLLVARAVNRRQEIAVRSALGATRGRLLSLAVIEGVMLALAGAAAGIGLAGWALRGALPLFAASLPRIGAIGIDLRVAAGVVAAAILTGVGFGLVVAFQGPTSSHVAEALRSGVRTAGTPREARARGVLVVSQVALAVVLLATAGLMVRSVVRLSRVGPGFDAGRLLTFRVSLDGARYAAPPARTSFAFDLLDRLDAAPGVSTAALNSILPFAGGRGANGVEIEGHPAAPGSTEIADQRHVTPGYFHAMGIPLVRGRVFSAADDARGEPVAVVNQTMARQFWHGADPVGQRIRVTAGFDSHAWFRIVGVVADVHHVSLSRAPVAEMYRPYAQAPDPGFVVVVKTAGDPTSVASAARDAVRAIDRDLPVYDMRTMDERVAGSFAETRATALLLLATALLAGALAAVAIYGSIWYSVAQRIPEIGVRLALGASRRSVGALVMGRAAAFGALGVAIGLAGAALAAPLVRGLLFDTGTADPATYLVVAAGVLALTVLASAIPARRAMCVDPMAALRNE